MRLQRTPPRLSGLQTENTRPASAESCTGTVPAKEKSARSYFDRMRESAEKSGHKDYMESAAYQAWLHWG